MTDRARIIILRAELAAVAATFLLFSLLHLGASVGVVALSLVVLILERAVPRRRQSSTQ